MLPEPLAQEPGHLANERNRVETDRHGWPEARVEKRQRGPQLSCGQHYEQILACPVPRHQVQPPRWNALQGHEAGVVGEVRPAQQGERAGRVEARIDLEQIGLPVPAVKGAFDAGKTAPVHAREQTKALLQEILVRVAPPEQRVATAAAHGPVADRDRPAFEQDPLVVPCSQVTAMIE